MSARSQWCRQVDPPAHAVRISATHSGHGDHLRKRHHHHERRRGGTPRERGAHRPSAHPLAHRRRDGGHGPSPLHRVLGQAEQRRPPSRQRGNTDGRHSPACHPTHGPAERRRAPEGDDSQSPGTAYARHRARRAHRLSRLSQQGGRNEGGDGDDESPVGCHDVHLVEAEAQS